MGTRVEVRSEFDNTWADGFEIAQVVAPPDDEKPRYKIRRLSDGMILPRDFGSTAVRKERKGGLWWYRP